MPDIHIPPEAVEAAARAAMKDNGCGYTVNGLHVLCDDPVCDGLFDPYGKPLKHECSCRSMATAAIRAALAAWPGMQRYTFPPSGSGDDYCPAIDEIILPLTENPDAEA